MRSLAIVAAAVLCLVLSGQHSHYHARYAGVEKRETAVASGTRTEASLEARLPKAWKEAQRQMARRYPELRDAIHKLERSEVALRNGPWVDDDSGDLIVGDTDLDSEPPVEIAITGDMDNDYETAVHEFKHLIIDLLDLGEGAHSWVDSSSPTWEEEREGQR